MWGIHVSTSALVVNVEPYKLRRTSNSNTHMPWKSKLATLHSQSGSTHVPSDDIECERLRGLGHDGIADTVLVVRTILH